MTTWTQTSDTAITAAIAAVGAEQALTDNWIDTFGNTWAAQALVGTGASAGKMALTPITTPSTPWAGNTLYRPTSEDGKTQRIVATQYLSSKQTIYYELRANRATTGGAFSGYLFGVDHGSTGFTAHGFAAVNGTVGTSTQFNSTALATQPADGTLVNIDIQLTQVTDTTSQITMSVTDATTGATYGTYDSGTTNSAVNNAALQNITGSVGICSYAAAGNSGNAGITEIKVSNGDGNAATATTYTLSGPTELTVGTAATYTLAPDAAPTADVTVTLASTLGGSFSSSTVKLAAGSTTPQTITFNASAAGSGKISSTNSGGLKDPAAVAVTATAPVANPTKYTVSPASSSVVSGASTVVTFTLDTAATSAVTITPSDGSKGGKWSASTLSIAAGATSGTLTYTAGTTAGTVTLTGTNTSSLTNGTASLTVTAAATAPSAPTFTLTAGNGQVVVNVTASSSNGGAAITGYPIYVGSTAGGEASSPVTTLSAAGSYTLTGLTNGSAVYVQVGATNSVGTTKAAEQTATPVAPVANPTKYTVTSAATSVAVGGSSLITFTLDQIATSAVTISPSDGSAGGKWSASSLTIAVGATSGTLTYTAGTSAGIVTLTGTNSASLANGSASLTITSIVTVDNQAFLFSPGNWYGDSGRGGSGLRRTWNVGAYFDFTMNAGSSPTATIDTTGSGTSTKLTLVVNGVSSVVSAGGVIPIPNLKASTTNEVFVVFTSTPQSSRYNKGANSLVINGVTLDAGSTAGVTVGGQNGWILIIGDSITEGIESNNHSDGFTTSYTYFVMMALRARGYEVCVSACGYSGYLVTGDSTKDVPAYFPISGTSRWGMIDQGVSQLDSNGHLSAYGTTGTEPVGIAINYLTNEALNTNGGNWTTADSQTAMVNAMIANRGAAPNAWLFQIMPFGFYYPSKYPAQWLACFNAAIAQYQTAYPSDRKVKVLDIGPDLSVMIQSNTGSLINSEDVHPLAAGSALIAPVLSGGMIAALEGRLSPSFVFRA